MSPPRRTPISMPIMPSPSPAIGQTPNPRRTLLQPHEHHLSNRTSFETLTSVASSNQDQAQAYSPKQLRRPALRSYHSDSSQHNPTRASNSRTPRQILSHHLVNRASSASLPPVRDMPAVLTHFKEVHWQPAVGEADQSVEGSADDEEEVIPAGLDLSLGSLYGFPYCMGVPNAMEQRAQDLAEAEEAEYQRERKEKARLSARVSSTLFKKVSLQSALSWTRRSQR
jgi:hypothetical protein